MAGDLSVRFISMNDPEFLEASRLRYSVLYEPLGISESAVEWGDTLSGTAHCVVFARGALVGYGRLLPRGSEAQIRHIAIAPSHRRRGIGTAVLNALIELAEQRGAEQVYLNARFPAMEMYCGSGFEATGPLFNTESTHLPHQRMELPLPRASE